MFSVINIMELINKTKKNIENLNQRFFLILENFIPTYVSYLQFPKNPDFVNDVEHIKEVVKKIDTDGFILKNEMNVEIDKSVKKSEEMNKIIDELQKENEKLKTEALRLKKQSLTSVGLYDDELEWYRKQIKIIIVMLIGIILCSKIFLDLQLNTKDMIISIGFVVILGVIFEQIFMRIYNKIIDSVS
jgi:hypothetical protein